MSINDADDFGSKVTVLLIGIGSAALVVAIYHCIVMGWCPRQRQANAGSGERMNSMENSTAQLIPAFKYQKGMGLGVDDEETGAICLNEFQEGEELRTLPECMHSYHVACIDMWLYSHTNCPMCRTDAVSPQSSINVCPHDLGMMQSIVVQTRTI